MGGALSYERGTPVSIKWRGGAYALPLGPWTCIGPGWYPVRLPRHLRDSCLECDRHHRYRALQPCPQRVRSRMLKLAAYLKLTARLKLTR